MFRRLVGSALLLGGIILLGVTLWSHYDSEAGLRARAAEALEQAQSSEQTAGTAAATGADPESALVAGQANVIGPANAAADAQAVSGTISIPSEGLEAVLRPTVSDADLDVGVGHYAGTAGPGNEGNFAIAAHRGLVPDLDQMGSGDVVKVEATGEVFTYTWVESFIVQPDDVWVLDPVEDASMLTLTTCHPRYSNEQRLVVRLELTDATSA